MSTVASDLLIPTALCFASLGFVGSGFSAAMGVGSSIVFVPMLLWLLPYLGVALPSVASTAVATSLAASCIVMLTGAWAHWRAGNLPDLAGRGVRGLWLAAGAGALLGGMFVLASSGLVLLLIVAGGQLLIAAVMLARLAASSRECANAASAAPDGIGGALAGPGSRGYVLLVGFLTTIGAGGVFLVPYFLWRGLSRAQAAALACTIGVAIAAAATALFVVGARPVDGSAVSLIHGPVALALALGALLGSRQGVRLASAVGSSAWTVMLVLTLVVSAARSAARILS